MEWAAEKHQINESVWLTSFKTDKFKTSVLKLSIVIPANEEENGSAKFSLLVNLLRSGTESYPEKEDIIKRLNELCDASCTIGGYASGDNSILEISSEMLDERFSFDESIFDGVAQVMNEMLLHPKMDEDGYFREEIILREKKVICDKLKSVKNNSREYAVKKCREMMCKGEAYGNTLSIDSVNELTREEITDFYRELISSSKISFSYVGALNGEYVADQLGRIFKELSDKEGRALSPLRAHRASELRYYEEELNVKQSVVVIGMRTETLLGDENAHIMPVLNNIYGGTFMSRLFKTLREKMSLCYYCTSDNISSKAIIFVSCGIDFVNFERARDEILLQLRLLQDEAVTEDELRVAKELAVKELSELGDYPSAIASFNYSRAIYGIDETITSFCNKIKSVSAADLQRVAKGITPDTIFFLKGIKKGNDPSEEDNAYEQ